MKKCLLFVIVRVFAVLGVEDNLDAGRDEGGMEMLNF